MMQFIQTYGSMILIFGVMILFMVISSRKEKKRQAEQRNMRNNLEVGDNVLMECGIVGRVVSTKDLETVVIETGSDKTKLRFKRWAIASKIEE